MFGACSSPGAVSPARDAGIFEDAAATEVEDELGDFMKGPPPTLGGELTYAGQIQPILRYYCTPCHEGSTPDGCLGNTCFVSFREALFYPAYNRLCPDMNKAQCGMVRIRNSQPTSGLPDEDKLIGPTDEPIVVTEPYLSALEAWLAAGTP
jgi:hypothetical protein